MSVPEGVGVRQEYNVLALIKGDERYVFVYDDDSRAALLEHFRQTAADAGFSFNWFDAAVLTEKAWEQAATYGSAGEEEEEEWPRR